VSPANEALPPGRESPASRRSSKPAGTPAHGSPHEGRQSPFFLELLGISAILFSSAFARQRLLDAELLARLQVESVPFDFPDNVFLQDLPLEAPQRVLQRLAFLQPYFSQKAPPMLTVIPGTSI
jgi:hypothetical protein